MSFDQTKSNFIRFGNCLIEAFALRDHKGIISITKFSDKVRYLGFHLKDKVGINLDFHVATRCHKKALEYEQKILKWCGNNYYFANKVKRSILHTRVIPKLFFGFQPIVECTNFVEFKNT